MVRLPAPGWETEVAMRTLVAALLLLLTVTPLASAASPSTPDALENEGSAIADCGQSALFAADPTFLAQRGCCSWHGGIMRMFLGANRLLRR
jgi:hypothetical protein